MRQFIRNVFILVDCGAYWAVYCGDAHGGGLDVETFY